ncbi:Hypothetical predicted protein [Mytilus galloprovincialis]|uniref:Reverse transcriptase/retrotransposon-derived protein RNase H-like domain-containing protein n=1 Tax=Mytilus galloprovincialis TaxID=29158 RepID=A0A8B6HS29_MYTGA|nr:Hypothetical predicted protein [Mytilus galloprovincialis]
MTPLPEDHSSFGHPIQDTSQLKTITMSMVADTGCQSSIIPLQSANSLGITEKDLLPVKTCDAWSYKGRPRCNWSSRKEHVESLKEWLLDYYGATTFNVCEHQPLPLMNCEPLQLHVDPNATPVAVHKPALVPIHWQDKVYADLERDVRIGVLEQVSQNTPTTWCSRMVVTSKADGTPRRTVDLQPQNRHSVRQTHHVPSPFHLADRVPQGLTITPTNIRPSTKFLDAISNFPTPTDITGARAWFGLINQGAYAFAMARQMKPFRALLKPSTTFCWTNELDEVFHKSKERSLFRR